MIRQLEIDKMIRVEICERYPNEWTLLVETDDEDDGRLKSGRVFDHDRSVLALLDRTGIVVGGTLIHTAGRPLCVTPTFRHRPRRETTPERVAKFAAAQPIRPDPSGRGRTKRPANPPRRLQGHATHVSFVSSRQGSSPPARTTLDRRVSDEEF
jgi:hypothetical protein